MASMGAKLSVIGMVLVAGLTLLSCGEEEKPAASPGLNCPLGACVVGMVSCSSDGLSVSSCVLDPLTGCGTRQITACGDGMACQGAGECVSVGCPTDGCVIGDSTCTDGGEVSLCVEGPDGCGLLTTYSCGERARCEQGVCVGDCVDVDDDGYGLGCADGPDCDDADPNTNPQGAEICDGRDNDCDGMTDEDFETLGEGCTSGTGACEAEGTLVCNTAGDDVICDAVAGAPQGPEVCGNDVDEDCDGRLDNGFDTLGDVCTTGLGVCVREGRTICARNGAGVTCDARAGTPEGAEICDGRDNDCDGEVDEAWSQLGQPCTAGVGHCASEGVWVCNETMDGVECDAEVIPPLNNELCGNDEDDDCDGEVDEGFPRLGQVCRVGVGACENVGVTICSDDGLDTKCSASAHLPGPAELCGNNADDDCDGMVDEGFSGLGTLCEADVPGVCGSTGVFACSRDLLTLECSAQEGQPGPERCDGLDNDCDDEVDEDFRDRGQLCTAGVGICARQGTTRCAADGMSTVCGATPGMANAIELCGNNADDDCNGMTDEGFEMRGTACEVGLGVCRRAGQLVCDGARTALVCNAMPGPDDLETCNGVDDDCDGMTDEDGVCGRACDADVNEPNDSPGEASLFSAGQVFFGTICFFDVDYFEIGSLLGGTPISINLLYDYANGPLQLEVYRDGNVIEFSSTVGDNERVQFVTPGSGNYTFAIYSPGFSAVQSYRLSMQLGGDCDDDLYESNDRREDGAPLRSGVPIDGVLCASNGSDWFDLGMVGDFTNLELDLTFVHVAGNLDIFLYRATGGPVASATSTTDNERIEYLAQQAGHYYAEIRLSGNARSANYRLAYTRTDDFCLDDASDMMNVGNDFATAIQLPQGRKVPDEGVNLTELRACPNDLDIFNLGNYTAGQKGQVNVIYDDDLGILGVDVIASNGQIVAVDGGNVDHQRLPFIAPISGTYYARVFAFGGRPDYRISNAPVNHGTCVVDVFENDNFTNQASLIQIGQLVSGHACKFAPGTASQADDSDLFDLGVLTQGRALTIATIFTHTQGDIDIQVYKAREGGADAVPGAAGESVTDNEIITFTVSETARYFLGVNLYADGSGQTDGNSYRLLITE